MLRACLTVWWRTGILLLALAQLPQLLDAVRNSAEENHTQLVHLPTKQQAALLQEGC